MGQAELLAVQGVIATYVHVQCLSIASTPAHRCRHDNELVLGDKVPDASFFACGFMTRVGLEIELEGGDERDEKGEEEPER